MAEYKPLNHYTIRTVDPVSAAEGEMIFNKTDNKLKVYYDGAWHEVVGGGGGGGTAGIPQYDTDPASPSAEDAWVLKTPGAPGNPAGSPIGLLLALTSAGSAAGADLYEFSYHTAEGITVRTSLN
jgi:hypothetical protein